MTQREVTEAQPVPRFAKGHHARHMPDLRRQSAAAAFHWVPLLPDPQDAMV